MSACPMWCTLEKMSPIVNPQSPLIKWLPLLVGALCLLAAGAWFSLKPPAREEVRVPIQWNRTGASGAAQTSGTLTAGPGKPSAHPGDWPSFRGPARDNIAVLGKPLARQWPAGGPRVLWRVAMGEGHAGAAIHQGRVYVIDYDRDKKMDVVRCLSFDDGQDIWRYAYPVEVKRNHGMSRTVPAVAGQYVVTLGPKCHVVCLEAETGRLVWRKDLVKEFGAVVPQWYAGQCPLIDGDRVILAPGGKPLMMAVDLASGRELWHTTEGDGMEMTHSSIATITFKGHKQYVYCAHTGVVGVAADTGRVLWTHPGWKINIANVPTPIPVGEDRIFFSGGYSSGCQMVQLVEVGGKIAVKEIFRLKPNVFGADQQTPILFKDHLYGVIPGGELACLDLTGKRLWASGGALRVGLGPYVMTSDGLILLVDDEEGVLHMGTADSAGYKELAKAKVLNGHDAWGPLAIAEGRVILRDLTEMICVDLGS